MRWPKNSGLVEVKSEQQIRQTVDLAFQIWNQHYPAIIGQGQVDYMLDRFQSFPVIQEQIRQDYRYYLIQSAGSIAGYTAFVLRPDRQCLQISKLYLLADWRCQGLARYVIDIACNLARGHGLDRLYLTVNKYNHATLAAYQKIGFAITGDIVVDIGNGFEMDDFEMELVPGPT